ncbi:cytochrome c [Lysobacter ciconiae]|uniref:Cytochrome c n=1 Tax=Novilysobacter ciconiae TaxID=2781022 RepID=A0A7S6UHV5_9GAMM|nr:cytochrome c [Lysobacter ciconiae]QOW20591.1 cytochrome c [Lysobacter ciconiae]
MASSDLVRRIVLLVVLCVSGGAMAQTGQDTSLVERGRYLATAADCVACHTTDPAKPFAGGVSIPTPFGQIVAPNITPDPDTGIGKWTDEEFYRAMHEGVGRNGENLYPAFPYDAFTKLSREDVLAIKAYLFSLPAMSQDNPVSELGFPFNQRWILSGWKLLNLRKGEMKPEPAQDDAWNRGAYLVEALAHCGTCHTPRDFSMGSDESRKFGGGAVGSWQAYNITPDPVSGIGDWSDDELVEYMRTGMVAGKGGAAGGMGEAVEHSLSKLPEQDLRDIVTYLRAQKPVRDPADEKPRHGWGAPSEDVSAFRGDETGDDPDGRAIFYGACSSCHGMAGAGTDDGEFPPLFRNTVVGARQANNLVMAILEGVHRTVDGETVSMEAFEHKLTSAEVAAVSNYVLKTYGNPAGATVDAAMVDELRRNAGEQPLVAKLAMPGLIIGVIVILALVFWLLTRRRRRSLR